MQDFYQLLNNEFLKQKGSFTRPMAIISPMLACGLTFLHLLFRLDYLKGLEANQDLSSWSLLLIQHHFIWMLMLPLTITVLASMIHYIEYSSNGWKNILALPVSRVKLYLAKWSRVYISSALSICLNSVLMIVIGYLLRFSEAVDWKLLLEYLAYQLVAAFSLGSFQSFVSSVINNPNISLAIGFAGVSSCLFFAQSQKLARLIPYAHMVLALPDHTIDNTGLIRYGIAFGVVFLAVGILLFDKREIY
jgi:hypothetical protein